MINFRKWSRPGTVFPLVAVVAAGAFFLFLQSRLNSVRCLNAQLNEVLSETLQEKEQLSERVDELEVQLKEKEGRLAQLGDAAVLRNSLDHAQKVIEQLNSEMAAVNSERISLQNANLGLTAKIQGLTKELTRNIDELKTLRESAPLTASLKLKIEELNKAAASREQQLAQISQELRSLQQTNKSLSAKNAELEKKAARTVLPGQDEARKLAEQLRKKEQELAAALRETAAVREKAAGFQANAVSLRAAGEGDGKLRELEAKAVSLQKRVTELQAGLQQKTELADSLQKNLLYVTQQLARKDEELRAQQAKYASLESRSQDELTRQQERYAEISRLYGELKAQLERMNDSLNLKNVELEQRRLESAKDREELMALRSRVLLLQKELTDTRERQKKTLDDLLSTMEKTREEPVGVSVQQRKADELKRRIEILLEPQDKKPQ